MISALYMYMMYGYIIFELIDVHLYQIFFNSGYVE